MDAFKFELEVDRTTLRFTPLGLSLKGMMRPADSRAYLEELIGPARLDVGVPDDVGTSFERVRRLHVHGLFDYGFFTLAVQACWLLPEAALGVRFLETYQDGVPFVRADERRVIHPGSYETVVHAIGPRGQVSRRKGWSLEGHGADGGDLRFDASYRSLLRWAHREGLLSRWLDDRWRGQLPGITRALLSGGSLGGTRIPNEWGHLNEHVQEQWWNQLRTSVWAPSQLDTFAELRNRVAHAAVGRVFSPIDSAKALRSVADMVNSLWGSPAVHKQPNRRR